MQTELQIEDEKIIVAPLRLRKTETPARPRKISQPVTVRLTPDQANQSLAAFVSQLARDSDSSDLINFPFAFTTYVILTIGLAALGWSMFFSSAWLAVTGLLITLAGGILYGLARFHE